MINNGVPTLIIGVGGIGCQIADSIYDKLTAEDKKTVSIIAMDTHVGDLWKLRNRYNMPCVQLCENLSNDEIINNNSEVMEWFPDEPYLRNHTWCDGAGMIRTVVRLEFVNAQKQGRLDIIGKEITRIKNAAKESGSSDRINICIMGTIVGGTGSCLAVCLPFYLRLCEKISVKTKTVIKTVLLERLEKFSRSDFL